MRLELIGPQCSVLSVLLLAWDGQWGRSPSPPIATGSMVWTARQHEPFLASDWDSWRSSVRTSLSALRILADTSSWIHPQRCAATHDRDSNRDVLRHLPIDDAADSRQGKLLTSTAPSVKYGLMLALGARRTLHESVSCRMSCCSIRLPLDDCLRRPVVQAGLDGQAHGVH